MPNSQPEPAAVVYGLVIRHLREAADLSQREVVDGRAIDRTYLVHIEKGTRFPGQKVAEELARALGSKLPLQLHQQLDNLRERVSNVGRATNRPSREDTMDETRRRLMMSLGALGVGATAVSTAALEPIRQALAGSLPDAARDHSADDWEEIALEYAHSYLTTPPAQLLPELAADVIALQHLIGVTRDDTVGRDLCRPCGQLAMFTAMTVGNLGNHREARHWWQAARHATDASADPDLRVWVRGNEAVRGLYEQRAPSLIMRRVDEAMAIAGDRVSAGVMSALAARAQMLALSGRPGEAGETLHALESARERLPGHVAADDRSLFGSPEQDFAHTASYVHTHCGNLPAAANAQERALRLYPDSNQRQRAQIQLHRASCLVQAGDITEGINQAAGVVGTLPDAQRTTVLLAVAGSVLDAVPADERGRPPAREYRELLALPVAAGPNALSSGDE